MVKPDNKECLLGERLFPLQELYYAAMPAQGVNKGILRSIHAQLRPGIMVKIVFVRHRSNKTEWPAILSTDTILIVEEIVQIYGIR